MTEPDPTPAPDAGDADAAEQIEPPEGLVLEEPPTGGSKNEHVRKYRAWLEAHPKISVRLPDFRGRDSAKNAQGTVAAFHRLDHFHATAQTDGGELAKVWVVYDPDKARTARKVKAAKKAGGSRA